MPEPRARRPRRRPDQEPADGAAAAVPAPAAADDPGAPGTDGPGTDGPGTDGPGPVGRGERPVGSAPKVYLVAARGVVNRLGRLDVDMAAVETNAEIRGALEAGAGRLIRTLEGPLAPRALGDGPAAQDVIYVAELDDRQAAEMRDNFRTAIVAEDVPVEMATGAVTDPGLLPVVTLDDAVRVTVVARCGGLPVAGANVHLTGRIFPTRGITDADGRVELTLYGERLDSLQALYVKPAGDCWSLWLPQPDLVADADNVVELKPLDAQYPGFPGTAAWGWGQVAMGLDAAGAELTGAGVRVAVVDSGVQQDHPNLRVDAGHDLVTDDAWGHDDIGHGTHCAGVICARDTGSGIRGFAPEAELHAIKVFPGAQVSHLLDALNLCIRDSVDVVNMSLGVPQLGPDQTELLQGKLRQARASGVACIVAAGNSGGPVQYPAALEETLAVAATGRLGTYPADSYHATQVGGAAAPGADGDFPARFTCAGPEVDVTAPGVAVLSTFVPSRYAAMDGTSMAAPHVAGLAALLVAHHPDLRGAPRDEARVARLFDIIRRGARKLPFAAEDDPRQGAGLPTVRGALAVRAGAGPAVAAGAGPDPADLASAFPMFQHLRPAAAAPDDLRAVQEELGALARLEAELTGRNAPGPAGPLDAGAGPGRDPRLAELDRAMVLAGLAAPGGAAPAPAEATGPAEDRVGLHDLDAFLQEQVEDLVRELRRYTHRYGGLGACVPLVDRTVRHFTAGEHARALAAGYQALACIRATLGGG